MKEEITEQELRQQGVTFHEIEEIVPTWESICGGFSPNEIKAQLSKGIEALPANIWNLELRNEDGEYDLLRITVGNEKTADKTYIALSIFPEDIEFTALYCKNTPPQTGTRLMRNAIELGKMMCKTQVELSTQEVGGYLWPRMGFMVNPRKDHSGDGYDSTLASKLASIATDKDAIEYAKILLDCFDHHPLVLNKIAKIKEDGLGKSVLLNAQIGGLIFPLQEEPRENPKQQPLSLKAMRNLNQFLRERGLDEIKPVY